MWGLERLTHLVELCLASAYVKEERPVLSSSESDLKTP